VISDESCTPDKYVHGPLFTFPPWKFWSVFFIHGIACIRNWTICNLRGKTKVGESKCILPANSKHLMHCPCIYLSDEFHPCSKDFFGNEVERKEVLNKSIKDLEDLLLNEH
jgi:hypothetical protein